MVEVRKGVWIVAAAVVAVGALIAVQLTEPGRAKGAGLGSLIQEPEPGDEKSAALVPKPTGELARDREELGLAVVPSEGLKSGPGGLDTSTSESGEAAPSFPGSQDIRIQGTVTDDEGGVIAPAGAEVRVYQYSQRLQEDILLGHVGLSSEGRYRFDVNAAAARTRRGGFTCRLLAPGYDMGEAYADVDDGRDGVIELPIEIDPIDEGVLITGRVVNDAGEPVGHLEIQCGVWSQHMGQGSFEVETDTGGSFSAIHHHGGWLTAFAADPAHGLLRETAELSLVDPWADLGTWVLEPRPVLAGRVVGSTGAPIPGVRVEALSAARDHGDSIELVTDEAGLFSFRSLPEGQYRLALGPAETELEDLPMFRTGTKGIQLTLPGCTVTVRAADAAGRLATADEVSLRALSSVIAASDVEGSVDGTLERLQETGRGTTFLASHRGRYAASAYAIFNGEAFSASRTFQVDGGHRDIDLALEPVDGAEHRIRLKAPAGGTLGPWMGYVVDAESGLILGRVSNRSGTVLLPHGALKVVVSPHKGSLVYPFTAKLTLSPESPKDLVLDPPRVGGQIAVTFTDPLGEAKSISVTVVDRAGKAGPHGQVSARRRPTVLKHRIAPGTYTVIARVKGSGEHRERRVEVNVTIRAGETTPVSIRLPARR